MRLNTGFEEDLEGNGVNLVPLLDVIFLLLLFFFYAVLKMQVVESIQLELPSVAQAGTVQSNAQPTVIALDKDHQLWIQKRRVARQELGDYLSELGKQSKLLIRVDKSADFGEGLSLLELAKSKGLTQVQIQVHEQSVKP